MEGTKALPLLINNWSDAQILKYSNGCGIKFFDEVHDCINDIRMLERNRIAKGPVETSTEVRDT